MAAERAQGLGSLRFAIDSAFIDETVYTYQSPDGRSSVCVEFEPIHNRLTDTSAHRLERAAAELTRVYDDAQISAPTPIATGAGVALVMRARVLGDVEIGAAALDLGAVRVYLTATAEGNPTSTFPVVVESIHAIGESVPTAPPEYLRTGAGTVSLCVPITWTVPSLARCRCGSAVVQIGSGGRDANVSPVNLVPLPPGDTVVLDGREQAPTAARVGLTLGTTVATYTILSQTGVPKDVIMMRATDVVSEADGRSVGFLLGVAQSADWPRLIQAWGLLVASVRVES